MRSERRDGLEMAMSRAPRKGEMKPWIIARFAGKRCRAVAGQLFMKCYECSGLNLCLTIAWNVIFTYLRGLDCNLSIELRIILLHFAAGADKQIAANCPYYEIKG